jgi:hypothetical protein
VNWDLSGTFFPYEGMFLPPAAPGQPWENDPSGGQQADHPDLTNVTFKLIDDDYAKFTKVWCSGFADACRVRVRYCS